MLPNLPNYGLELSRLARIFYAPHMRNFMTLRVCNVFLRPQVLRVGVDGQRVAAASDEAPVFHSPCGRSKIR